MIGGYYRVQSVDGMDLVQQNRIQLELTTLEYTQSACESKSRDRLMEGTAHAAGHICQTAVDISTTVTVVLCPRFGDLPMARTSATSKGEEGLTGFSTIHLRKGQLRNAPSKGIVTIEKRHSHNCFHCSTTNAGIQRSQPSRATVRHDER